MRKNTTKTNASGRSAEILTEVPEPDQIESGKAGTEQENQSYSGTRGNMILYLADRQDRISDHLNRKIEHLGQRITPLEELERS
jgi:hypothetical protein